MENPVWTWTKGKQGDWLVRGPWKCPHCEGTGITWGHGSVVSESHACTFCTGKGEILPPANVTVVSKAGKAKPVVLRHRLWKHPVDNVALWSIYDSKPAKPFYGKTKPSPAPASPYAEFKAAESIDPGPKLGFLKLSTSLAHESLDDIPEPVEPEPEPAPLTACSLCGSSENPSTLKPARDRDGLRGSCCPVCVKIPENERDFG